MKKLPITFEFVFVFVLLTMLISCTNDEIEIAKKNESYTHVIPLEEAVNTLDRLLGDIYGATKAGPKYDINEAIAFGGITTKRVAIESGVDYDPTDDKIHNFTWNYRTIMYSL